MRRKAPETQARLFLSVLRSLAAGMTRGPVYCPAVGFTALCSPGCAMLEVGAGRLNPRVLAVPLATAKGPQRG